MAKDTSPEEKLLSLIRNKKKKTEAADAPQAPAEAQAGTIISKADARIDGVLKSGLFRSKIFEPSALKRVNRYLVLILSVLVLYFLADLVFVRPYKNVQLLVSKTVAEQNSRTLADDMKKIAAVKEYSAYSGAAPGRGVFGQAQSGPAASEDVAAQGSISDRVGLVGIITGDNPQAIIEDKKAQKTYYLNKGQSFDGYVVEEILEGKVTLDYEGKKISLFL